MAKRKTRPRRRAQKKMKKQSRICRKAKRLVKRKATRRQGRALFAQAARQGKPCNKLRARAASTRRNPMRYAVVAITRKSNARRRPYYWTGRIFDTNKKAAQPFDSVKAAGDKARSLLPNLPPKIRSLEVQRL